MDFNAAGELTSLKLSYFGLAKGVQDRALGDTHTRQSSRAPGTVGYMDPECFRGRGQSTKESDVYSFGIVCLDLIVGGCGGDVDHYRSVRRRRVTFHTSWDTAPGNAQAAILNLAETCTQEFCDDRPSMLEVSQSLTDLPW